MIDIILIPCKLAGRPILTMVFVVVKIFSVTEQDLFNNRQDLINNEKDLYSYRKDLLEG